MRPESANGRSPGIRQRLRPPASLKLTLLVWIVPALMLGMSAGLWLSNSYLAAQVQSAYDRTLAGILRAIDLNISTTSGGLALEQPYRLLEFFQLTAVGNIYYRVATEDGLAEIGFPALPLPEAPLEPDQPVFYDARYLDGEPVRVAALLRTLDPPLHRGGAQYALIQVAEGLDKRETFIQRVTLRAAGRDIVVVLLGAALLVAGVIIALRPLARLRREVAGRSPDDLSPITTESIPAEVLPLVDAVNRHMARFERQSRLQRQFLDDASHQLRTPLTVLQAQVGYALREPDPAEMRNALKAMDTALDRAVRVTNQMLALARAQDASLSTASPETERFDLCRLVEDTVRLLLPAARQKRLDYGLDLPDAPVMLSGQRLLLQEAVTNLLHNAIRYSPPAGRVAVSVSRQNHQARFVVEDNGPGMSAADIARAGTRFRRGAAGKAMAGAGLGLAIVQTIVQAHHGEMRLESPAGGDTGLRAILVFTLNSHTIPMTESSSKA